ncbi:DUF1836 domain-containing protein [Thermophilibacter sp.]
MGSREKGAAHGAGAGEGRGEKPLAERMRAVHIARVAELPRIELYLDQVITLVSQELAFMTLPGETLVTGSMVNNYVKQGVIPAPHRKRYTRRHVASLVFVCALKRVFSIAQVKSLMELVQASGCDLGTLYDDTCALFEEALAACFSPAPAPPAPEAPPADAPAPDDGLSRLLDAAVAALATKVYVEQTLGELAEGEGRS